MRVTGFLRFCQAVWNPFCHTFLWSSKFELSERLANQSMVQRVCFFFTDYLHCVHFCSYFNPVKRRKTHSSLQHICFGNYMKRSNKFQRSSATGCQDAKSAKRDCEFAPPATPPTQMFTQQKRAEKGAHLPSPGSRFHVCFFVIFRVCFL